jgi:RNA polymerase sigma factor (sigma-70 family)
VAEEWRAQLAAGDTKSAWDSFVTRYRRLIIGTIRRTVANKDDVAEVFAEVCAALSTDDMSLLQRHVEAGTARFSTWLVTVVHHRAVDWMRQQYGRRRVAPPPGLTDLQRHIFQYVFGERRSHVETYEVIRQRVDGSLSFGSFLSAVSDTYKALESVSGKAVTHYMPGPPVSLEEEEAPGEDALHSAETGTRLASALKTLPPDERLAIQLFVIDELPADRVARIVRWPNAKAVYNRVYRALALVRKDLERQGFNRDD